ncbi:hypothetical protein WA026_007291 [Henosepilachna vigintioctopunctata]|uniref:Retinol dehydrogenase 14 n=1 Tax=Henosepilachna vigintioctopunctata TaxID=420089 RepID=A0AAW1UTR8_9CUCU
MRGCKVIIACRSNAEKEVNKIKELTDNPNITSKRLNLCSLKSVRAFAEEIKNTEPKIDILINNAGALVTSQKISEDGLNALMQTNYFGAFLLTHLLLEPLKASKGRVVFLTSALAYKHELTLQNLNMTEFESKEMMSTIYPNSKLCNILAAQEFAKKMNKLEIKVNCADPGIAYTQIFLPYTSLEGDSWSKMFLRALSTPFVKEPIEAAQTTFHLAISEELEEENGELYFRCKPFRKPDILSDQQFVAEIWRKSEELVGLKPDEKL